MRSQWFAGWVSLALALSAAGVAAEEPPHLVPAPTLDNPLGGSDPQTAVLAGGCYWGMQGLFEHVKGVRKVIAGMTGQMASNEDALLGGHNVPAETIEITFDPAQISYGRLLQIYFSVAHDPTQVDRQGPDSGPRYRSVIYYGDDTQQKIAEAYIAQLQAAHAYAAPIATHVEWLHGFRRVDGSQQDYILQHPTASYVVVNDLPRIAALKTLFPDLYVTQPVTVQTSS